RSSSFSSPPLLLSPVLALRVSCSRPPFGPALFSRLLGRRRRGLLLLLLRRRGLLLRRKLVLERQHEGQEPRLQRREQVGRPGHLRLGHPRHLSQQHLARRDRGQRL